MSRYDAHPLQPYRGYKGTLRYSPEDDLFIGEVLGVKKDSLNFHGKTVDEAMRNFHDCVDWYIGIRSQKEP